MRARSERPRPAPARADPRRLLRGCVSLRQDRRSGAPEVQDPRIVPGQLVLVRIFCVVLLSHVIAEQNIGQRLEAVRVTAGDVEGDGVLVTDVLAERLSRLTVEHDDAGGSLQAGEKGVLTALVVMESADHAATGEGHVRLQGAFGELRLAP